MKPTDKVREAYQQYLDGKCSLDDVLDLAERTWESIRAGLPPIPEQTPEEIAAEEAEWARIRVQSPAAPLREAYQRYLDGKCTLDDVLDLADRIRAAATDGRSAISTSAEAHNQG
jgi:hypothetical protein